jgi:hypothetical protein
MKLKEIDLTTKTPKEKIKLIKNLKKDSILMGEEQYYVVLVKEGIVISEISCRYESPEFFRYTKEDLIKELEEELEE